MKPGNTSFGRLLPAGGAALLLLLCISCETSNSSVTAGTLSKEGKGQGGQANDAGRQPPQSPVPVGGKAAQETSGRSGGSGGSLQTSKPEPEPDAARPPAIHDAGTPPFPDDASPPSPPPAEGLAALSDDFAAAALASDWQLLNQDMFDFSVTGGKLEMRPRGAACDAAPYCVWFEADQGPALYKLVPGNFMVSSRVHARSATNPAAPPPAPYLFAGLIARDPRSDQGAQNYVFTVVGHRDHLTNELKNTVDDSSRVSETGERADADLDLRICRIGQRFMLLSREIGTDTWVETARYDRTEQPMSTTLQVGPIAYNYATPADIIGQFEHVTFAPIATFADCSAE